MRADPPTPAKGSTPAREIYPFRGEELAYSLQHTPIPAAPPYAVRTPHIHGASDYGATIIYDVDDDDADGDREAFHRPVKETSIIHYDDDDDDDDRSSCHQSVKTFDYKI